MVFFLAVSIYFKVVAKNHQIILRSWVRNVSRVHVIVSKNGKTAIPS